MPVESAFFANRSTQPFHFLSVCMIYTRICPVAPEFAPMCCSQFLLFHLCKIWKNFYRISLHNQTLFSTSFEVQIGQFWVGAFRTEIHVSVGGIWMLWDDARVLVGVGSNLMPTLSRGKETYLILFFLFV